MGKKYIKRIFITTLIAAINFTAPAIFAQTQPKLLKHSIHLPGVYSYDLKNICKDDIYFGRFKSDEQGFNTADILKINLKDFSVSKVPELEYLTPFVCDIDSEIYYKLDSKFDVETQNTQLNIYRSDNPAKPLWSTSQPQSVFKTYMWNGEKTIYVSIQFLDINSNILIAIDKNSGQQLWEIKCIGSNLGVEFENEFFMTHEQGQQIDIFDTKTGKLKWTYNSPALIVQNPFFDKDKKIALVHERKAITGLDAQTGKFLWQIPETDIINLGNKKTFNNTFTYTNYNFNFETGKGSTSLKFYETLTNEAPVLRFINKIHFQTGKPSDIYDTLINIGDYTLVRLLSENDRSCKGNLYLLNQGWGRIDSIKTQCSSIEFAQTYKPNQVIYYGSQTGIFGSVDVVEN